MFLRFVQTIIAASVLLAPAFAQLDRGTLTGTVTDATASVIPNASIVVQNTSTGVKYDTATNTSGQYTLPNLPAGSYRITVTYTGMKQLVRNGLDLGATQVLRVDLVLEVGAVARLQTDSPAE